MSQIKIRVRCTSGTCHRSNTLLIPEKYAGKNMKYICPNCFKEYVLHVPAKPLQTEQRSKPLDGEETPGDSPLETLKTLDIKLTEIVKNVFSFSLDND